MKRDGKNVLIVRLDAIGDWILFRNTLAFLRKSACYANAQLTVLGNPAWQNLTETYDLMSADHWLWAEARNDLFKKGYENLLPQKIWQSRLRQRQAHLRNRLLQMHFDEVIVPQAFADPCLDMLVDGLAPQVIKGWKLPQGDADFVFLRNRAIVSSLVGEKCDVELFLPRNSFPTQNGPIMFFTGASHWTRRWPLRYWKRLQVLLEKDYSVCYASQSHSLSEFIDRLSRCRLVVSNDTMAVHAAAALGVPAVCITNGLSGKGAFWPYPKCVQDHIVTLSVDVTSHVENLVAKQILQWRALCRIAPDDVASAVSRLLG